MKKGLRVLAGLLAALLMAATFAGCGLKDIIKNKLENEGKDAEKKVSEASKELETLEEVIKDELSKIETAEPEPAVKEIKIFDGKSVGDTVFFGSYEIDNNLNNGDDPIEWQILAIEKTGVLLISKQCLECIPYHYSNENVTWATCDLRQYLNDAFIYAAFLPEDLAFILDTTVTAADNDDYGISGGADTTDKIFCLSMGEVSKYFKNDSARKSEPTAFAKAQGAFVGDNGCTWWWLRNPGNTALYAANVNSGGDIYPYGSGIDQVSNIVMNDGGCVRPAMWVDINAVVPEDRYVQ